MVLLLESLGLIARQRDSWRDVLYYIYFLIAPSYFPVTIRLNERDDQQMIARLNRFEILDQMSGQGKHVLPEE